MLYSNNNITKHNTHNIATNRSSKAYLDNQYTIYCGTENYLNVFNAFQWLLLGSKNSWNMNGLKSKTKQNKKKQCHNCFLLPNNAEKKFALQSLISHCHHWGSQSKLMYQYAIRMW